VVRSHRRAGWQQDSTVRRVDGAPGVFLFGALLEHGDRAAGVAGAGRWCGGCDV